MTKNSARRITFALALLASTLATAGVARAQTITGTDPVPKGCGCVMQPPAPSATSVSTSSVAAQALLAFLGLA